MLTFLECLFSSGELIVSRTEAPLDQQAVLNALIQYEVIWRNQMSGEPPTFLPASAFKAARILMVAIRALVHRDVGLEQVRQSIQEAGLLENDTPAEHYSVDLTLRFLPQLADRAARIAEADPMLKELCELGRQWPLSSVGMKDCGPVTLPTALQHPSL